MKWFDKLVANRDKRLKDVVREAVEHATEEVVDKANRRLKGYDAVLTLQDTVTRLKEEVEDLKIQKSRKEEEFARREREVEHKLGLHKSQVAVEMDEAKRKAVLDVEEEHLSKRKEQFQEQMEFMSKRFEGEVKYIRGLIEKMLKRLPSAEIIAEVGGQPKEPKED